MRRLSRDGRAGRRVCRVSPLSEAEGLHQRPVQDPLDDDLADRPGSVQQHHQWDRRDVDALLGRPHRAGPVGGGGLRQESFAGIPGTEPRRAGGDPEGAPAESRTSGPREEVLQRGRLLRLPRGLRQGGWPLRRHVEGRMGVPHRPVRLYGSRAYERWFHRAGCLPDTSGGDRRHPDARVR